jgi:hypothetical protein
MVKKAPHKKKLQRRIAVEKNIATPVNSRRDQNPRALVIVGMHRSGTSAITRLVSLLGADLPKDLLIATPFNEAGHWESVKLMRIHDRILASAGTAWRDWRKFNPDWHQSPDADTLKQELLNQLKYDFGNSQLFVIKDPRICRLVPFWLDVLAEFSAQPAFILPVRNPIEVCDSLKRRDGMLPSRASLLWLRHVVDAEVSTRGLPRAVTTYDMLLEDWQGVAAIVSKRTNIVWPRRSASADAEIEQSIIPRLRHHVSENLDTRANVIDWLKIAYDAMLRLAKKGEDSVAMRLLDEVREAFDKASSAFGLALAEYELQVEQSRTQVAALQRDLLSARALAAQGQAAVKKLSEELEAVRLETNAFKRAVAERESELRGATSALIATKEKLTQSQVKNSRLADDRLHSTPPYSNESDHPEDGTKDFE